MNGGTLSQARCRRVWPPNNKLAAAVSDVVAAVSDVATAVNDAAQLFQQLLRRLGVTNLTMVQLRWATSGISPSATSVICPVNGPES